MAKAIAAYLGAAVLLILVLPALVTILLGRFDEGGAVVRPANQARHSGEVLLQINSMLFQHESPYEREAMFDDLEEYIVMVVAAEMPALFHIEALKAQAVAARTYAVHQLIENPSLTMWELYQAYTNEYALHVKWGGGFDYFMARIRYAVSATRGKIMVYGGEPILAVFHAMSAGTTEVAENVWRNSRPYLLSVFSADYASVATFRYETAFTAQEKARLLGGQSTDRLTVTQRSPAGYVLYASFGAQVFSGREIRQLLNLRSTNFSVTHSGDIAAITTVGHGHGVGMSQHGANIHAQNGMNHVEILRHYYHNIGFGFVQ